MPADAGYAAAGSDLGELNNGGYLTTDQISQAQAKARDLEQVVIRAVTARGCSGWNGEFDEFPSSASAETTAFLPLASATNRRGSRPRRPK